MSDSVKLTIDQEALIHEVKNIKQIILGCDELLQKCHLRMEDLCKKIDLAFVKPDEGNWP